MKHKLSPVLLTAAFLASSAFAAERIEKLYLDSITNPKRWSPAESSVVLDSVKFSGRPVLKWTAPIDHYAGEKRYPVGWPRTYLTKLTSVKPPLPVNWSEWDFFEFDVTMKLEGNPENKVCPVTFTIASSRPAYSYAMRKLHDGKRHSIKVPIARITSPRKIIRMGFAIAESNYKHGAKLTVCAGNFRLTRSSFCFVEKATVLTPAVTKADTAVKLKLHVSGPANDVARGIPFQLVAEKNNSVVRKETLPVQRGERDLEIAINELELEPGNYTLNLFPDDKTRKKSVSFKLLESPYKVKK